MPAADPLISPLDVSGSPTRLQAGIVPPSLPARSALIGESLTRPLHLLWIGVLPQILLLVLNARAYHLVSGEMSGNQHTLAAITLAAELALMLGTAALSVALHVRKQALAWGWNWPLLAASIGYLAWALWQFGSIRPENVPNWIVNISSLVYYQFVLVMPLAFYAGLRLACYETARRVWIDLLGALLIGGSVFVVVTAFATSVINTLVVGWFGVTTFVLLGITLTLLLLGSLARGLAILYVVTRGKGPGAMAVLIALVGIAGPIGGLSLNAAIPFPVDLQGKEVYALAVLNGLLLLLPNHRHPLIHRVVWLSQCALFPFSLYFFLVFLPVLPLCLPAMLFMGSGLLIVVPSLLFVVHAQRLVDGYRCEVRDGAAWVPALLGVLAALVIPCFYVGGAMLDRVVLRQALDYAYTPSYQPAGKPFAGSPARVRRSLEHLRDFKAGLDLPFLTDLYTAVVFQGLVLPDEKMQHLHRVFVGGDLPEAKMERASVFSSASPASRGRGQGRVREVPPRFSAPPPTQSVVLANVSDTITAEGLCERRRVMLTMENTSADPSEFVTQLHVPEAVHVTGFWLHIGPEVVPGRLVERKTALWVYHRIRDAEVRRDPGLLLSTGPETLELRVYPFEAHQERTAEIEFLYPAALSPAIRIGERELLAGGLAPTGADAIVATDTGGVAGTAVTLTPAAVAKLPPVTRCPYLHFVIDRSEGSDVDGGTLSRVVQTAAERFPDAREALLTAANFDCQEPLGTSPVALTELQAALKDEAAFARRLPPLGGGFLQERALKRGLLRARDALAHARNGDDPALGRYPVFIVVRGSHAVPLTDGAEIGGSGSGGLATWADLVPERGNYYVANSDGRSLESCAFSSDGTSGDEVAHPVALLHCGEETAASPASAKQALTLRFPAVGRTAPLSVYDPGVHAFRAVNVSAVVRVPADAPYARTTEVALLYRALLEDPSVGSAGLSRLAALSKERRVLIGMMSFIVVENTAQWRILEEKEKQKLANAPALEIEEVPEPGTWVMILISVAIVAVVQRRRSKRA